MRARGLSQSCNRNCDAVGSVSQSGSQAVCQLAGESVTRLARSPGELRVGVIDNRWQCKLGAYIKTCGSFASLARCLHLNDFYTLQSDGHEIETRAEQQGQGAPAINKQKSSMAEQAEAPKRLICCGASAVGKEIREMNRDL